MKNGIRILMIILVVSLFCIPVVASNSFEKNYVTSDNIEIILDDCSEKVYNTIIKDMISTNSINNINIVQTSNILCIFGHSLEKGSLTRVTHNANPNAPRCYEEIYYYEVCTRSNCDYAVYTLASKANIYCH